MVKKYYCLYGASGNDVDSVADQIASLLEVAFTRRHSSYSGDYCLYRGTLADELSVMSNYNSTENDWREEAFKDYQILVYVSNSSGKNLDRQSRSEHIKHVLVDAGKMPLLRERIIESNA